MIEVRDLSFSYGDKAVLSDFSTVFSDPVTVIRGPSGGGKTTLLYLLAGLLKPDAGVITGIPDKVSFMFQQDRLIPWLTARENVQAVLPKNDAAKAEKWLRIMELDGEMDRLPGELSGGQMRRVALARALSFPGEIIIMDEPLKGLDEALIARLVPIIKADGRQIIVTSHSESETTLWGGTVLNVP